MIIILEFKEVIMESIKLSQLNSNTYIIHGKRNGLAVASLLLYRLYHGKRLPSNSRAIINNKNCIIEVDVKKENIVQGFKCWVCDKYLGESLESECNEHPYSKNENYAPEYVYIIKSR
jgi:hypothetical protein